MIPRKPGKPSFAPPTLRTISGRPDRSGWLDCGVAMAQDTRCAGEVRHEYKHPAEYTEDVEARDRFVVALIFD
jgi:hypothetical protein